jgi:CAAX prenyl protease-like protein
VIRSTSLPYYGPFVAFLCLLALQKVVPFSGLAVQAGFVVVMLAVIVVLVPAAPDFRSSMRIRNWGGTLLLGIAVFAIWIAPDRLFPGYRHFWLFENPVMGQARAQLSPAALHQPAVVALRALRAVAIVPLIEELFWRSWLMRWIISPDFLSVKLGTWSAQAFWIVAVLFASEHGPYWDVGLAAGVLYNWWMLRTRSLGDLVLAHAVTNACLSLYVVMDGKWQYWQ